LILIDADRDKEITGEELVAWLTKIEENFRRKTALEHLKIYDLDGDNMVSDDEFRNV
jgi:Ca2+-binding EF-hand superfamily protein